MIVEFKSKAAGAFLMTEPVMRMVFAALDLEVAPQGIITAEQVPAIRAKLEAAVSQARLEDRAQLAQHDEARMSGQAIPRDVPIGLSQRAYPLLDMLRAAEAKKVPVVWGV